MGQGFWRNVDDGYSDPDMLGSAYRIGRSAYFEVELTLAEFNDKLFSNTGGLQGSPTLIAATATGPGGTGYGCPEKSQYVWVGKPGDMTPIMAKTLLKYVRNIRLYNPLTRHYNLLTKAQLLEDVDLYKTKSLDGTEIVSSFSHKVIKNTADKTGIALSNYLVGGEVLRAESSSLNIFQDQIVEISYFGKGDVIEISLEKEYIYASGTKKTKTILAHNQKEPGEVI